MSLEQLGPFFTVESDPGPGWHALRELAGGPVLEERVDHTRSALATMSGSDVELRVAASTMSLGLFARLLSPVLGAAVLSVPVPRSTLDSVHWQPAPGGPWPWAIVGDPEAADLDTTLAEVVRPLADAIAAQFSLSTHVVRGNVTSALFGAATMIGRARPDLAGVALDRARLQPDFVRDSCCLYYRIPGGGYCGDCVLAAR